MITSAQKALAALWWGPARPVFEPVARAWTGRSARVLAGPLRGRRCAGGIAQRLGVYELPVQQQLMTTLTPGDRFFDVGANDGYLSLLAAVIVGSQGRVEAFEPLPEAARTIRSLAAVNGVQDHLCVHEVALSETDGEGRLYLASSKDTKASLRPDASGSAEALVVATRRLDSYAATGPLPALVKIDVEGAEAAVLRGAVNLAASSPGTRWLIEVHGADEEREVTELLVGARLRVRILASPRRARVHPRHLVAEPRDSR